MICSSFYMFYALFCTSTLTIMPKVNQTIGSLARHPISVHHISGFLWNAEPLLGCRVASLRLTVCVTPTSFKQISKKSFRSNFVCFQFVLSTIIVLKTLTVPFHICYQEFRMSVKVIRFSQLGLVLAV